MTDALQPQLMAALGLPDGWTEWRRSGTNRWLHQDRHEHARPIRNFQTWGPSKIAAGLDAKTTEAEGRAAQHAFAAQFVGRPQQRRGLRSRSIRAKRRPDGSAGRDPTNETIT